VATHRFSCPTCGKVLKVDDEVLARIRASGQGTHCPACKAPIGVEDWFVHDVKSNPVTSPSAYAPQHRSARPAAFTELTPARLPATAIILAVGAMCFACGLILGGLGGWSLSKQAAGELKPDQPQIAEMTPQQKAEPEPQPTPAPKFKPKPLPEPRYQGLPMSFWFSQLADRDMERRRHAQEALGAIGEPALPGLFEIIDAGTDPLVIKAAWECAASQPALSYLVKRLQSNRYTIRSQSAISIMLIGRNSVEATKSVAPYRNDLQRIFLEILRQDDAQKKIQAAEGLLWMRIEEPLVYRQLQDLVNHPYHGSWAREILKQMRARFGK